MADASQEIPQQAAEQQRPSLPERLRTRLRTWWTERFAPAGVTKAYMDMYDRIGAALGSGSLADVYTKCRGILDVQAKMAGIAAIVGDIALVPVTAGVTLRIGRFFSPIVGSPVGFMVDQLTGNVAQGRAAATAVGDFAAAVGAIRAGVRTITEAPLQRLGKAQARMIGTMAPKAIDQARLLKDRVDQTMERIRQPKSAVA